VELLDVELINDVPAAFEEELVPFGELGAWRVYSFSSTDDGKCLF
jgi:hypothetical protein